jgi:hypothetical protein
MASCRTGIMVGGGEENHVNVSVVLAGVPVETQAALCPNPAWVFVG